MVELVSLSRSTPMRTPLASISIRLASGPGGAIKRPSRSIPVSFASSTSPFRNRRRWLCSLSAASRCWRCGGATDRCRPAVGCRHCAASLHGVPLFVGAVNAAGAPHVRKFVVDVVGETHKYPVFCGNSDEDCNIFLSHLVADFRADDYHGRGGSRRGSFSPCSRARGKRLKPGATQARWPTNGRHSSDV